MEDCRRTHIGQPLRALATFRASLPTTIYGSRCRNGTEFVHRVLALSLGLRNLGMQHGSRVAIAALNSDWYLEWILAVPCAGGIIAPLNYRWSVEEASAAIQRISASILVVDDHCLPWCEMLRKRCPSLQILVRLGDGECEGPIISSEGIIGLAQLDGTEIQLDWAPKQVAVICFTSGTTGRPKGVALSHNALIVQSLAKLAVVGYSSNDVYLHTSPMCHIGAISSALAMIMVGACHVIIPKFSTELVFRSIQDYNVSAFIAVPTMLSDIVSSPSLQTGSDKPRFLTVRIILNGAGGTRLGLLKTLSQVFPAAKILSAYGMTEACSSMTFLTLHDASCQRNTNKERGVCVGRPAPHVEICIEPVQDKPLRIGAKDKDSVVFPHMAVESKVKEGNVLTRGPHVMEGYWGQPVETSLALSKDGWLYTGDVGWLDEQGRLWLLGRSKYVIKSGGENVYSSEVEDLLLSHPAISATVVVGVPDTRLNEAVVAAVALKEGWKWDERIETQSKRSLKDRFISTQELISYCKQAGLSGYKIPKHFYHQQHPFPLTSTGKVKRDLVKASIVDRISNIGLSRL